MDFLLSELHKNTVSIYKIGLVCLSILIFWGYKFYIYRKNEESLNLKDISMLLIIFLIPFVFSLGANYYSLLSIKEIIINRQEATATVIDAGKAPKSQRRISFVFNIGYRQILSGEASEDGKIGEQYKVYYSALDPPTCRIDLSQVIGFDSIMYKRVVLGIIERKMN
jgi:hypothetical protein